MPQGRARAWPYSIWQRATRRLLSSSRLPVGARITSDGMRYSNIEPDQDISAAPWPTGATARPRRNHSRASTSPLAMAMNTASRASEASRS